MILCFTSYSNARFAVPNGIPKSDPISFQFLSLVLSRRLSPFCIFHNDPLVFESSTGFFVFFRLDEKDLLLWDETFSEGEDGTLKQSFPPKVRLQSSWLFMI